VLQTSVVAPRTKVLALVLQTSVVAPRTKVLVRVRP